MADTLNCSIENKNAMKASATHNDPKQFMMQEDYNHSFLLQMPFSLTLQLDNFDYRKPTLNVILIFRK
jgi:hypothetical protein